MLRIGEISKILGVRPETIRYYEQEQIVSPQRKKSGTFREYGIWDLFDLLECRRFREMDFSIKDVKLLLKTDNWDELIELLSKKQLEIFAEANQKLLLATEMKTLTDRITNASLNIGNYWFKAEPEKIGIHLTERNGRHYADLDTNNFYLQSWLGKHSFVSTYMHVLVKDILEHRDRNEWFLCTSREQFEMLGLLEQETFHIPEQVYLHTVLDIGGKEDLTLKMLEPVLSYVKNRGIEIDDYIIGEYLMRCYEGKVFHRYAEIMVPVKKS